MATIGQELASEFARIESDRDTIRNKLVSLGKATSTATLDTCAAAVDSISNNGAVDAQVKEGESYTIPEGYHNGSGTVKGIAGGGNYTLQAKSVTPTKSQQSVTSDDGYYGLSSVTVEIIPDAYQDVTAVTATAADVLSPKVFVSSSGAKVTGTIASNGAVSGQIDGFNVTSVTVPAGYTTGGTVELTDDILVRLQAI